MPTPYLPSRWLITTADTVADPDVFPFLPGQMFLQLKTPVWSTKVDTSVSGIERRRALWSYPVWRFDVGYEVLRDGPSYLELQQLFTFFNLKLGQFKEFFYYDKTDHSVSGQGFGTGDGVTTSFQLVRTMTYGSATFSEPVRGLAATPTIYVNGTATSAYTVNAGGLVTFTTPPAVAAALTWTGTFYFLVRFEKDEISAVQLMTGLWNGSGLAMRSVK